MVKWNIQDVLMHLPLSGTFPTKVKETVAAHSKLLREGMNTKKPQPRVIPPFTPKVPEVAKLPIYNLKKYPKEYWDKFPYRPLTPGISSYISPERLEARAIKSSFPAMDYVLDVSSQLREGVSLGFRGAGRLPAEYPNLKTFYETGYRSMDTIASWVKEGLMCGPLDRHQLPLYIRSSPAGGAEKPNGRRRVTVDMSHPHLPPPVDIWSTTTPCSPNASIDKSLYKTVMVTSKDVLVALQREGTNSYMAKADW